MSDHGHWMDIDWRRHLRCVRVQGRLVNVVDIGQGPAIVFLHGLAGCWQNWLETIPEFARDHRVIAIDFPGFGRSEMPAEPISIPGYVRMLDELFGALAIGSATIVGNSMGGFVGADMAIRLPHRVERLVLVAAAGLSMEHMLNERNQGLRARIENVLFFGLGRLAGRSDIVVRSPHLRRGLLLLVVAHPERLSGPLVLEQVNGAGKPGFHPALEAMVRYPIRDRLGEIDVPTLIAWGELDRLVPLRDADEFEWLIHDARKVVYEDAGHMVMLERPERFNADVRSFIEEPLAILDPWHNARRT
ncbi:MAG: alpha/beta fold hydrolase [Solirubrobacteraceae bacterium]